MNKIAFKDIDAQYINRIRLNTVSGETNVYDVIPEHGTITTMGTPVRSSELNQMQDNIEAEFEIKVDKVTGKYLSTNDYTNEDKVRLANTSGTNTGDQDLSNLVVKEVGKSLYSDTQVDTRVNVKKNQPNGIIGLDTDSRMNTAQLPIGYDKGVSGGLAEYDTTAYRGLLNDSYFDGLFSDTLSVQSMTQRTGTGTRADGTVYSNPLTFKDVSGIRVKEILGQTMTNLSKMNAWSIISGSTKTISGSTVTVTGTGTNVLINLVQENLIPAIAGRKLYVSGKVRVTNSNTLNLVGYMSDADYSPTLVVLNQSNPVANQWYPISTVVTLGSGVIGNALIAFYAGYADSATANGKVMEVQDIVVMDMGIDVTSPFYSFTASQMQSLAPNWFDVTVSVVNPAVRSVGKNQFDFIGNWDNRTTTGTNFTLSLLSNGYRFSVTGSYAYFATPYIQLLPNTQYTFKRTVAFQSGSNTTSGITLIYNRITGQPGGGFTDAGAGVKSNTFTTDSRGQVRITIYASNSDVTACVVDITDIQLEPGSAVTAYEPYKSSDLAVTGTLRSVADTVQLMNETSYNPTTWAEWTKTSGYVTSDSSGMEMTVSGTAHTTAAISTTLTAGKKYCLLVNVLSNNVDSGKCYIDAYNSPLPSVLYFTAVGNLKYIFAADSDTTAYNKILIYVLSSATAGQKIKFKDFRIYELVPGSQIEEDANNLTVDQLAIKYPWVNGTGTFQTGTISQDRLYNSNGKWLIDRWVNEDGSKKTSMTTEQATVSGNLVAYKSGTIQILNSSIAPKCNLQYVESDGEYETYTPTLTWGTATPSGVSSNFKYTKKGKRITVQGDYLTTNGAGATGLTVSLPFAAKSGGGKPPVMVQELVNGAVVNCAAYLDDSTSLIKFRSFGAMTSGQSAELHFTVTYEMV